MPINAPKINDPTGMIIRVKPVTSHPKKNLAANAIPKPIIMCNNVENNTIISLSFIYSHHII
jgi:hypothetical protein